MIGIKSFDHSLLFLQDLQKSAVYKIAEIFNF
jgi:hypothetical protein